jgi:hypothetical protein
MGNLSNSLTTEKVRISLDPDKVKSGLYDLISFDLDFTENEEYFRQDTISLGYKDEAERLIDEYLKENKLENKQDLFECSCELLRMVFDSSFYGDWVVDVSETSKENEYVVYYSYIS